VFSSERLAPFLKERDFILLTDHKPLLQDFASDVEYVK
jgi:hypothetical protein